ncbi:MAG: OFA family oxalate/formate antiporter-like MFS transporter [Saprospiraceae bacterium]
MNRKLTPSFLAPQKWPFFYGWIILLVGSLGLLMSAPGQTIGVSAFTDPLLDALGLSRDQLSIAYMIGTMMSAILLTKAGIFFDRFGAMRTALIASVGMGIALLYLSQMGRLSALFGGGVILTMGLILFGFVFIRFFGQGVLTLASRTMVVKWFDARRGMAVGILSMITAYGFSMAPVVFNDLIDWNGWSQAWMLIGVVCIFIFPIIILLFYKRDPADYGLKPDGFSDKKLAKHQVVRFPIKKEFSLNEARKTMSLWVYSGLAALYGLVITGFTFNVVSIFATRGLSKEAAFEFFQPIAIVAIVVTICLSWLSDYIKLKYIAYLFGIAGLVAMYSTVMLGKDALHYWLLVGSFGTCSGIHPLILTLFLPRFFGKQHLGAITGQAMTLVVFSSAIGPVLFSQSLTLTGSYNGSAYICGLVFLGLLIAALFTRNPQEEI